MLNSLHNHTLTESHRYNHRESPIHSQRVTDTITESHRYNHRESPIQSQKVTDTITESHRYNHREPPISSLSSLRYRSAIAPLSLRYRSAIAPLSLRSRFALASLALAASHRRQSRHPPCCPQGGKSRHPPTHSGCSLLEGHLLYLASLALRARASHIPPQSHAQSLPRPSSRRGLLPCNAPLVGARSRSPRVGEGATLKRGLVLLPRRLLRFVSARSRSPFLSLRKSGGSASFVSPRLAAARSTLPPCCPQSNPTALLPTRHQPSQCSARYASAR